MPLDKLKNPIKTWVYFHACHDFISLHPIFDTLC